MWGRRRTVRSVLVAVFALAFMSAGVTSALSQEEEGLSITAESNECETVTIHYYVGFQYEDEDGFHYYPYNSTGTVNGNVRNGNGAGWSQIVFTNVAPGLAVWSGSMFEIGGSGDYFNQGTVQVEPCPVTTTTTTQPDDTTTSTIAQVETDLSDTGGLGFGFLTILATTGVTILGSAAIVASRREG